MPRQPRAEFEAGIHHVYARGAVKQKIFYDNRDRRRYMATLKRVLDRTSWRCLSVCLMTNHMHLLIETGEPDLAKGMHLLHGSHAQAFNRRHRKAGHVFGARYGANRIENDAHLWVTARYIARNPVEAKLCRTPADWPWSSHSAIAAGVSHPPVDIPRLLSYFAPMGGDPRRRYLEFVDANLNVSKGAWPL
jgi:putative transposase